MKIKKNGVTINLTESDLKRIVKKQLNEEEWDSGPEPISSSEFMDLVKDNLTNESVTKFIFVSPKKSQLYFDLMPDKDVVFVFDRNTNLEREAPSFIVKY
jgi:hypothetical protein